MQKLLKTICAAADLTAKALVAAVAVGALLPFDAQAVASTPPSTLVDLTTSSWGSVTGYSACYNKTYTGAKAFDDNHSSSDSGAYSNSRWLAKKADNMYVIYKFKAATVVDAIQIFIPENGGADYSTRAPKVWTFEGSNDNSSWDTLDTQDSETGWAQGDSRYYTFANTKAYQYYKFNCTAVNGGSYLQVQELEFYCIGTKSTWTGGGTTDLLNDDANWGGSSMPGSGGEATINNSGSTPAVAAGGFSVYKHLWLGTANGKSAQVVQTNGAIKVLGGIYIGQSGGVGEYVMTGGELSCTELHVGYESNGNGKLVVSGGVVRVTGGNGMFRVGRRCTGTLEVGGTGQMILQNELNIGKLAAGKGTVKLSEGGTITATGIIQEPNKGRAELVEFDGGTLNATQNNASFLKDLPNIQLKAGGLTINTQGKNLGINNCTFNVTGNGKITVVGGGTVTFTNVTLNLPAKPSGAYVFAETDGTFSGLPNLSGIKGCKISLSDDCKRVMVSPRGLIISIF